MKIIQFNSKKRKINVKLFFLVFIGIIGWQPVLAQPGWVDNTQYFSYILLDDKDEQIQFKNNKNFKISVNKVVYDHNHLPHDKLPIVIPNADDVFSYYIQINDFSLVVDRTNAPVLIEIISNKDTMHFFQPNFIGYNSFTKTNATTRNLKFVPGHYYFPSWVGIYFDSNPIFSPARIKNLRQQNFIIPATIFNRISGSLYFNEEWEKIAEDEVVENFLDSVQFIHKTNPIAISKSFDPYINPKWTTDFFPSNEPSIFYGLISYTYETPNLHSTKYIFARYNRRANEISQWFILDDLEGFSVGSIYPDTFNQVLYISTFYKNKADENATSSSQFKRVFYKSTDFGLTWDVDSTLQHVFAPIEVRKIEIIDANHALAYTRRTINKGSREQYDEGTYYLLKDKQFVDSLKSPKGVHYNSNYNQYGYKNEGDSVFLGPWGIDPQAYYNTPYTQPVLVKTGNEWKFELLEKRFIRHDHQETVNLPSLPYNNFTLTSENRIEFKNTSMEPIELRSDFATHLRQNSIQVLEREQFILFVQQKSIIMTFDGGNEWYFFPLSFENGSSMKLLTISEKNELNYFNPNKLTIEKYTLSFNR